MLPQRRRHLEPGGCFVIEVVVPGLQRLPPGERFLPVPRRARPPRASTSTTSPSKASSPTITGSPTDEVAGPRAPFRYVWPAELDLMARARRHDACASASAAGRTSRSRARARGTSRCGRSREARRAASRRRVLRVDAAPRRHLAAGGSARRRGSPDRRPRAARPQLGGAPGHRAPLFGLC